MKMEMARHEDNYENLKL
jgi:chromosome segregation ATPase